MKDTVIFIHGMFQNAKSWSGWVKQFSDAGFDCIAESWPLHEGEPSSLRETPPTGLGDLRLQEVIDKFVAVIERLEAPPIAIGHSVGGLFVQKLAELGLIRAGVPIASVAPNRMLAIDWGFFRNSVQITNPFKGDEIFEMTPEAFHQNFANVMNVEDSNRAYAATATHDSRNILRDCMLETGQIDLKKVQCPLLFLSAEKDEIIPAKLCEKNAKAYEDNGIVARYIEFHNRGHFICGEPGWEEVAKTALDWVIQFRSKDTQAASVASLRP